jgi:hypothetical protein
MSDDPAPLWAGAERRVAWEHKWERIAHARAAQDAQGANRAGTRWIDPRGNEYQLGDDDAPQTPISMLAPYHAARQHLRRQREQKQHWQQSAAGGLQQQPLGSSPQPLPGEREEHARMLGYQRSQQESFSDGAAACLRTASASAARMGTAEEAEAQARWAQARVMREDTDWLVSLQQHS